jgi:hypothetical protein
MKFQKVRKIISFISCLSLLLQTFVPLAYITPVYADDSAPAVAATSTITPTDTPISEVSSEPTVTSTPSDTPTPTPTAVLSSSDTSTASSQTIEPSVTLAPEITPVASTSSSDTVIVPSDTPVLSSDNQTIQETTAPPVDQTSSNNPSQTSNTVSPVSVAPVLPQQISIVTQLEAATTTPIAPTISTDKSDYFPTDTVHISGANFLANTAYVLHISSQDNPIFNYNPEVTSDENGNISFSFVLDGNYRPNYFIEALDSDDQIVTSMSFTDGNVKVSATPNETTFTLTLTAYNDSNCTYGSSSPVTIYGVDNNGKTYVAGNSQSVKLKAANLSNEGRTFKNWTTSTSSTFSVIDSTTICAKYTNTSTHQYNANYNAPSGTIRVYKDVRNSTGSDAADTQAFSVQLNNTNTQSIAEGTPYTYSVTSGSTNSISEISSANYDSMGCKLSNGTAATNFTVPSGQNIDVTCTNRQKKATITISKDVLKFDGTQITDTHSFSVTLNGETKSFAEGSLAVFSVEPGTYSAVESTDPNYTLYSNNGQSIHVNSSGSASVQIVNKQNEVRPTLKLVKSVDLGPNQAGDWTLSATGTNGFSDAGNSITFHTVNSNTNYTLSESTNIAGYTQYGNWSCTAGSLFGNTLTLSSGQNATCTVTNHRDTGSVLVNKQIDLNGDGDYNDQDEKSNTRANQIGFRWYLDSSSQVNNMGNQLSGVPTTIGETVTHSITENGISGYHFVGWSTNDSCINPNTSTTVNPIVVRGQTVTVTLCNARDTGSITIIKNTIPSDNFQDFSFSGSNGIGYFTLDTDTHSSVPSSKIFTVGTGLYTIQENDIYNWKLTDISCNNEDVEKNIADGKVDITVSKGSNTICTFTNTELGKIQGVKFNDENGNGVRDVSQDYHHYEYYTEYGLENWRIFIDGNNNGLYDDNETHFHTNWYGDYEFDNLLPGTYSICEQMQDGWTNVTPICSSVNLTAGQTYNLDFANRQYGSISGVKWNDLNGNGTRDQSCTEGYWEGSGHHRHYHEGICTFTEPTISGWTISLTDVGGLAIQTAVTSSDGSYQFAKILSGTYQVCEVQQAGWTNTYPSDSLCQTLTVRGGESKSNINFGNQENVVPTPTPTATPDNNSSNNGPVANNATPPVCNATTPTAVTNLQVINARANTVTLAWNSVTPVTHYALIFTRLSDGAKYGSTDIGFGTTYTITNISGGDTYKFEVFGVNDCAPGQSATITQFVGGGIILGRPAGQGGQVLGVNTATESGAIATPSTATPMVLGSNTATCQEPWWRIIFIVLTSVSPLLLELLKKKKSLKNKFVFSLLILLGAVIVDHYFFCLHTLWPLFIVASYVVSNLLPFNHNKK